MRKLAVLALFLIFVLLTVISFSFIKLETENDADDIHDTNEGGDTVPAETGSKSDTSDRKNSHTLPEDAAAVSSFKRDTKYLVSEYDGKIAVFKEGETDPMWVLSSSVLSLPEPDRAVLKEGIEVTGAELDLILSDFVG